MDSKRGSGRGSGIGGTPSEGQWSRRDTPSLSHTPLIQSSGAGQWGVWGYGASELF